MDAHGSPVAAAPLAASTPPTQLTADEVAGTVAPVTEVPETLTIALAGAGESERRGASAADAASVVERQARVQGESVMRMLALRSRAVIA